MVLFFRRRFRGLHFTLTLPIPPLNANGGQFSSLHLFYEGKSRSLRATHDNIDLSCSNDVQHKVFKDDLRSFYIFRLSMNI